MDEVVGKTCPYCQTPIKPGEQYVFCSLCGIPHHRQCWSENSGCTTFGCKGTPASSIAWSQAAAGAIDISLDCLPDLGGATKACPFCGETIMASAIKCRFCKSGVTWGQPAGLIGGAAPYIGNTARNTGVAALRSYPKASSWRRLGASIPDPLVALLAMIPFFISVGVAFARSDSGSDSGIAILFAIITFFGVAWAVYYTFTKDGR